MPGPIPMETRVKIIEMHGRGCRPSAIAQQLNISERTARRWVARYNTSGCVNTAPILGRPKVTTTEEDERILAVSRRNPLWPVRRIRALLRLRASIQTHWRRLRGRMQLRSQRRKDLQLAKQTVKTKRLVWAEQMIEEWSGWGERTVYIDEAHFESCTAYHRKVWREIGQRGLDVHYVGNSGRFSIHVFGGICDNETLPLLILPRPFDAATFTDLLQEFYLPVLTEKFGLHTQFKFVLDNAPVHHSKIVQDWLEEESLILQEAFTFLPPYSNDLNPIENVWARMKLQLRDSAFTTADQLTAAVLNQWDLISQDKEFVRSLTHSMTRRIRAVIVAQGGPTRY